jgi:hypothetical protein
MKNFVASPIEDSIHHSVADHVTVRTSDGVQLNGFGEIRNLRDKLEVALLDDGGENPTIPELVDRITVEASKGKFINFPGGDTSYKPAYKALLLAICKSLIDCAECAANLPRSIAAVELDCDSTALKSALGFLKSYVKSSANFDSFQEKLATSNRISALQQQMDGEDVE